MTIGCSGALAPAGYSPLVRRLAYVDRVVKHSSGWIRRPRSRQRACGTIDDVKAHGGNQGLKISDRAVASLTRHYGPVQPTRTLQTDLDAGPVVRRGGFCWPSSQSSRRTKRTAFGDQTAKRPAHRHNQANCCIKDAEAVSEESASRHASYTVSDLPGDT